MALTFFYPSSTFSYVSIKFYLELDIVYEVLDSTIYILHFEVVTQVHHSRLVMFMGFKSWDNQVILDLLDFNIILGMN